VAILTNMENGDPVDIANELLELSAGVTTVAPVKQESPRAMILSHMWWARIISASDVLSALQEHAILRDEMVQKKVRRKR
jgi:hypothetical protein